MLHATTAMGAVAAESVSTECMSQTCYYAFISSINSVIKYLSLQTRIQTNLALASTVYQRDRRKFELNNNTRETTRRAW
ncbi:hypothetical protein [Brenneria uluponensis]|uniref:hypothetical protein n=1 Tax=Brenneria uluponensis TaxID=3057057 RepID=UPI0028E860E8|nr:hypothetical protein [Brenneria ulupoensis]